MKYFGEIIFLAVTVMLWLASYELAMSLSWNMYAKMVLFAFMFAYCPFLTAQFFNFIIKYMNHGAHKKY